MPTNHGATGAEKWRWAAVPTNGTIGFAPKGPWNFPAGTVLVKHFELPVNETNVAIRKRLETRFLIRSSIGTVFGATYKWRADNTDADLLTSSLTMALSVHAVTEGLAIGLQNSAPNVFFLLGAVSH